MTCFGCCSASFVTAGYQVPQIVFWNVRNVSSKEFPASNNDINVAMVSGFSPSVLKLLMEEGELAAPAVTTEAEEPPKPVIDPYVVMRKAIDDEKYACLQL